MNYDILGYNKVLLIEKIEYNFKKHLIFTVNIDQNFGLELLLHHYNKLFQCFIKPSISTEGDTFPKK